MADLTQNGALAGIARSMRNLASKLYPALVGDLAYLAGRDGRTHYATRLYLTGFSIKITFSSFKMGKGSNFYFAQATGTL